MAKAIQPEELALAALGRIIGDPAPRVLHGGKGLVGVFASTAAAEKAAANLCLDHGWLVKAGELPGKGKAKKELFILSPAGIQAVLAQTDPKPILESLRAGLERIESQSANIVGEVRGNLIAVLETVKTTLLGALEPLAALRDLTSIKQSISQVLERIKPVDVGQFVNKASGPVQSDAADDQWLEVVLRMAADQRQMNPFQRLTLPQIFERLKGERLNLSLGQFHDGLRRLHQQNRIRLGPFTQALATLDDPRNALYLDREVKYYVELP